MNPEFKNPAHVLRYFTKDIMKSVENVFGNLMNNTRKHIFRHPGDVETYSLFINFIINKNILTPYDLIKGSLVYD